MSQAWVPVINAVVQIGSRTFKSTSGTTLTVAFASVLAARAPTMSGIATAPAIEPALLIISRREMVARETAFGHCHIRAPVDAVAAFSFRTAYYGRLPPGGQRENGAFNWTRQHRSAARASVYVLDGQVMRSQRSPR